jgi:hypothetical protein
MPLVLGAAYGRRPLNSPWGLAGVVFPIVHCIHYVLLTANRFG